MRSGALYRQNCEAYSLIFNKHQTVKGVVSASVWAYQTYLFAVYDADVRELSLTSPHLIYGSEATITCKVKGGRAPYKVVITVSRIFLDMDMIKGIKGHTIFILNLADSPL